LNAEEDVDVSVLPHCLCVVCMYCSWPERKNGPWHPLRNRPLRPFSLQNLMCDRRIVSGRLHITFITAKRDQPRGPRFRLLVLLVLSSDPIGRLVRAPQGHWNHLLVPFRRTPCSRLGRLSRWRHRLGSGSHRKPGAVLCHDSQPLVHALKRLMERAYLGFAPCCLSGASLIPNSFQSVLPLLSEEVKSEDRS
jgi:hypothetical protein